MVISTFFAASSKSLAQSSAADDDKLEVYPYVGIAVDNFAAADVNSYLNYEESGEVKTRETFGIAFQYPLLDSIESAEPKWFDPSFWIYGQTIHGVRSADVDCEANETNALCAPFSLEIGAAQADASKRALYILRNASSLEGMLGFRFEVGSLPNNNARLYVNAQYGFVAVDGDDDDIADVNHIGFGVRVAKGRYQNSYLEIGRGQNDLFADNKKDRSKINVHLVTRPRFLRDRAIFFAHLVVDVDGGAGADSVQSYLGFAFCFGKGNTSANTAEDGNCKEK